MEPEIPSAEASRLFGDGDLEGEIHDFLAKFVKDPETKRRLFSGWRISDKFPLFDSYTEVPVPRRGPKANFEAVILGPTSERVDFRLKRPLPFSRSCMSSIPSNACLLNDWRTAFPPGFVRTFSEKVRMIPLLSGVECSVTSVGIWVKLADRGSDGVLNTSEASDIDVESTLLAAAAEASEPSVSTFVVII